MPDYYHSITTLHALQNAWRAVRAKNAAGGIDGFTLSHFEKRLNDNLKQKNVNWDYCASRTK